MQITPEDLEAAKNHFPNYLDALFNGKCHLCKLIKKSVKGFYVKAAPHKENSIIISCCDTCVPSNTWPNEIIELSDQDLFYLKCL